MNMKPKGLFYFIVPLILIAAGFAAAAISALNAPTYGEEATYRNELAVKWHKKICVLDDLVLAVNKNGTVRAQGNWFYSMPASECGFDKWKDIASIVGYHATVVALKNDGRVLVKKIIKDSDRGTYSIVNSSICSNWRDMVDISMCRNIIMGVKNDGTVLAIVMDGDEVREEQLPWENVESVQVSLSVPVLGIDKNGKLLLTGAEDIQDGWSWDGYLYDEDRFTSIRFKKFAIIGDKDAKMFIFLYGITKENKIYTHEFLQKDMVGVNEHDILDVYGDIYKIIYVYENGSTSCDEEYGINGEKIISVYMTTFTHNEFGSIGIDYFIRSDGGVLSYVNGKRLTKDSELYDIYSLDGYKMRLN